MDYSDKNNNSYGRSSSSGSRSSSGRSSSSGSRYSSSGRSSSSGSRSSSGRSSSSGSRSGSSSRSSSSGRSSSSSNYRAQYAKAKKKKQRRRRRRINWRPIILLVVIVAIILVVIFSIRAFNQRPKLKLIGESTVTTAQGEPYVDEGVTATQKKEDILDSVYEEDDVDTEQVGTYEVIYYVEGPRRTVSVTRKVEVTDQTAPEITLNGDDPTIVDNIDDYADPGATAIDNCDGDISADITSDIEQSDEYTWLETYSVSDQAGNEATAVRTIQLRDDVLPEITLNGEEYMTLEQNTEFDDPGVTATDNRDGDISDSVKVDGFVDIYRSGTYEITYTATDSSGNEASVTRTVEVESNPVSEDHTIYLTFDDGPSSDITPQILDTLKANDVKATFFICDFNETTLPIVQRAIDEGHTIGIHGYSHEYSEIYASPEVFMDNIHTLSDKLKDETGYEAFCIRFPGGSSNTVSRNYCEGIMSTLVQEVTDEGWAYYDWNVSSGDAEGGSISVEEIVNNVESELGDGENVVLMHDYGGKQTTADSVQAIIDYGKENGYSFYPITRETTPIHHEVNN